MAKSATFLGGIILIAFACAAAASDDFTFIVSKDQGDQLFPQVYGDMAAWSDFSQGSGRVAYSNLVLGLTQNLQASGNSHVNGIYGNNIVYANISSADWDIYAYNFDSSRIIRLTNLSNNDYAPSIYEDKVVFHYGVGPYSGISLVNMTSGKEQVLRSYMSTKAYRPRIFGDIVVWDQVDTNHYDLLYFNLTKGGNTGTVLVRIPAHQMYPDIYGKNVVWMDNRNGNWDIYLFNMTNWVETQVTNNPATQANPRIFQNLIVWEDNRYGNFDIYLYNISSKKEKRLTWNESNQKTPAIWGKYVIWNDYRGADADIYGRDLTINLQEPQPDSCLDSGQNYYVPGWIAGSFNGLPYNYSDRCENSSDRIPDKFVREMACNGVFNTSQTFDCPDGCKAGACISIGPSPSVGASPTASSTPAPTIAPTNSVGNSPTAPPFASRPPVNQFPSPTFKASANPSPKSRFAQISEEVENDLVKLREEGLTDPEAEKLAADARDLEKIGKTEQAFKLMEEAKERVDRKQSGVKSSKGLFVWFLGGAIILLIGAGGYYYYENYRKKEENFEGIETENGYESAVSPDKESKN